MGSERIARELERQFQDIAVEEGAVRKLFFTLQTAMTQASTTMRGPDPSGLRSHGYLVVADHHVRITAARIMAQILGLVKTNTGTTITNTSQTLNLGRADSLAELAAVGVPRETVEAACRDLLASVSVSEAQTEKATK